MNAADRAKAEKCVKDGILLIAEARRYLTIREFQDFIRDNEAQLGARGFLCSIGKAILDGATLDVTQSAKQPLTIEHEYEARKLLGAR